VGNPVATGCECKHRKCVTATHAYIQARPSWGFAAKNKKSGNIEMKPIKGEGG